MEFEWDENKNLANIAKHGIGFELACLVFEDPRHLVTFDQTIGNEERWRALGNIEGRRLLLVVHTYRNKDNMEVIRIISARRPNTRERGQYENRFKNSRD